MTRSVSVGVGGETHRILILGSREEEGRCLIEGKDLRAPPGLESQADTMHNPPIMGQKPKGLSSGGSVPSLPLESHPSHRKIEGAAEKVLSKSHASV